MWTEDRRRSDLIARNYTKLLARRGDVERPSGDLTLSKKILNNLIFHLKPILNKEDWDKFVDYVFQVTNDNEFQAVKWALSLSLSNSSRENVSEQLHRLDKLFNDDGDKIEQSPIDILRETLNKLRELVDPMDFSQCAKLVNDVDPNNQDEVDEVTNVLTNCLIWHTKTHDILEEFGRNQEPDEIVQSKTRRLGPEAIAPPKWWEEDIFGIPHENPQDDFDFFICHRGVDTKELLAKPLYAILRQLGLTCFVDARSIRQGEYNQTEVSRALHSCRFGVVLISDNFLQSKWCRRELRTLYHRHTATNEASTFKLLPFFDANRLLYDEDFKRVKEIASVVRNDRISDRSYLIDVCIPKLLSQLQGIHPEAYNERENSQRFAQLLDEYLDDPTVTAHASLRKQG